MLNSLNVNTPNMLKQNTKLKSKNQNLEKNAVTLNRNTNAQYYFIKSLY